MKSSLLDLELFFSTDDVPENFMFSALSWLCAKHAPVYINIQAIFSFINFM
jgi:hypothetical protein